MNAIQAAEQAGIDLSLIDESLRLTPEQRALQHQSALEMALQLEEAYNARRGERRDDGTQSTAAKTLRR
jgi:pheromone shutdown protein TraB